MDQKPFFTRLILSTGLVSTDQGVQYVLLGIAILLFALAFLIPSFIGGSHARVPQNIIDASMKLPAPAPTYR